MTKYWIAGLGGMFLWVSGIAGEPTRAVESSYNKDILDANTSDGLNNADLAGHAKNTFGFDCAEVVTKKEPAAEGQGLRKRVAVKRLSPRTQVPAHYRTEKRDQIGLGRGPDSLSREIRTTLFRLLKNLPQA